MKLRKQISIYDQESSKKSYSQNRQRKVELSALAAPIPHPKILNLRLAKGSQSLSPQQQAKKKKKLIHRIGTVSIVQCTGCPPSPPKELYIQNQPTEFSYMMEDVLFSNRVSRSTEDCNYLSVKEEKGGKKNVNILRLLRKSLHDLPTQTRSCQQKI